ncbi:Bax inhibitor-1/YccA family protein [Corynebacterium hindlerae]|uniref:Bax inhibitor-1/YccA family protein n=1 Tax=Corynebacterium hindlerae TaxID=699041 RepID=UPI001AD77F2B|nr:Bax inhibitor-1/YccA family protein [Corynebacterium hindlerae]QTH60624.1 Bax inhibitor-1/YccA family protein [Corynebacterium hindlerae]
MRSSNPVFSSLTKTKNAAGRGYAQAGYDQAGFGQPGYGAPYGGYGAPATAERAMTVDDVVSKTGIVLGIIMGLGALVYAASLLVNPAIGGLALIVGAIGGLITVLIATFGKKYGSAPVTIVYAVFEGLFVGGVSFAFAGFNSGIIGQAVIATIGVFVGMLWVYKAGVIRVTPKFTRFITAAIVGVLFLAVGNLISALVFGFNPLRGDGPIAIGFSIVCIILASLSFLQDFDSADQLVRAGAPAKMAWGVALGLAVTLVWLYTEILRLLSILRD